MSDVKAKTGAVLRETAVLTGAVAIIAAGVFFFLVPSPFKAFIVPTSIILPPSIMIRMRNIY